LGIWDWSQECTAAIHGRNTIQDLPYLPRWRRNAATLTNSIKLHNGVVGCLIFLLTTILWTLKRTGKAILKYSFAVFLSERLNLVANPFGRTSLAGKRKGGITNLHVQLQDKPA